jgi:hypothetical protein
MNAKTRFLTASLASLAVASAVTLTTPTAFAADEPGRACGLPAVAAVYVSVIHEPELRTIPAVTHDEWRWERDVTTFEYEFSTTVSPAYTENDWTRDVPGVTEYQWSHKVVEQEAVPAVPGTDEVGHWETVIVTPAVTVTMFEYEQQQTGHLRWEADGWNADKGDTDTGKGWVKTGRTREDVTTPAVTAQHWVVTQAATDGTPAVPEISHLDYLWAASSPGAGWTGPLATRTAGGGTESSTTTGDDVPAGDGWTKSGSHIVPAVVDTIWALTAPDGYAATGESRVHDVVTEQTDGTSAAAPDGDGWSKVVDSGVVVVDQPAGSELVGNGWTEHVLVSPEVPASEPCVAVAAENSTSSAAGPKAQGSSVVSAAQAAQAATADTVLPATGSPVSPLLLTTGLGALLAGGVLVRIGRRRQTS